jgi:hypothetical protein
MSLDILLETAREKGLLLNDMINKYRKQLPKVPRFVDKKSYKFVKGSLEKEN